MEKCKQLVSNLERMQEILRESNCDSFILNFEKIIQDSNKKIVLYSWLLNVVINYRMHYEQFHYNSIEYENLFNIIKSIRHDREEWNLFKSAKEDFQPSILLSHNSSDTKYADALEKFIIGLGVKNNQLIYTSHPLHKIPINKNINDYLRKNIHHNILMIILWSNEYLENSFCLNEMGAAWKVQCDYVNMYVPDFLFDNPKYHECAIDTQKMGIILNGDKKCKQAMLELKNKIETLFGLNNEEGKVMYLLDNFLYEIM